MQKEANPRQYIAKVVNQGIYHTQPAFNHKVQNLLALIHYIETLEPSKDNVQKTFKLIKFYRFPIIITFRHLYQKFSQRPETHMPEMIDTIKQIASYVASMLEATQIKLFEEIKFIFEWGRSKKKFKLTVTQAQTDFAKFVYDLSKEKKAILDEIKITSDYNDKLEDLMSKLDDNIMQRQLTPFEEHFIQIIKDSTLKQIQRKCCKADSKMVSAEKKNQANNIPLITKEGFESPVKEKMPQKLMQAKKQFYQNEKSIAMSEQSSFDQQQLAFKQEKQQPMCCRQYFVGGQIIEQSQNLRIEYKCYQYPFVDQKDEKPTKSEKIKRVMCGFLNTEGGIIFFGIRQDRDSKKRSIKGYHLSEKKKAQFKSDIFFFLKDVLPDIGKHCTIKWVPVKSQKTQQYGNGLFVPKVIIEKGAKDQLYSYLHQGNQKFAFKTQNQFLIENEPQKILKIFSNRLRNPQRPIYKLHEHPCKEPMKGKPVYEDRPVVYEFMHQQRDFPSLNSGNKKYDFQNQHTPSEKKSQKNYQQKWTNTYLVQGLTQEQIKNDAPSSQKFISFDPVTNIVVIPDSVERDCLKINNKNVTITEIFSQIQVKSEHKQVIEDIVAEFSKIEQISISNHEKSNVFRFGGPEHAVSFWLKMQELGIETRFTRKPK